MNDQMQCSLDRFYSNSPYSSQSKGSRESMMNTPLPSSINSPTHLIPPFAELQSLPGKFQQENWNGYSQFDSNCVSPTQPVYAQLNQSAKVQIQQDISIDHQNLSNLPTTSSPILALSNPGVAPSTAGPPLPAIANFMKEIAVKEEFSDYYNSNPNDYRVEKVSGNIVDPYLSSQIEPPTYTDFTNAQMINQQDMLNQMNFPTQIPTNYMGSNSQTFQFNLFDFNISSVPTFNCDNPIPLVHQSQAQQYPLSSSNSTYTPPPQDPLVVEPKPVVKKRMAAVQCHQNSICSNCKTRETTLWRRNGEGGVECNACNLYFRKNNRKRPLSLRKDGIMKRNRRPRNESPNGPIRRHGHAAAC